MPNCPTCGSALAEKARFCGTCGQVIDQAPAPAPAQPKPVMAKTMIGVPSPLGGMAMPPPQAPPPQALPPPQAPQAPQAPPPQPLANQTMLGMPQIQLPPHLQHPQQPQQQQQQQPAPQPAPLHPSAASKTMLGVAAPGIAPVAPGQAPPLHQIASKTMLGVAAPGIAPIHGQPGHHVAPPSPMELPPIVPAPAPLQHEALPQAPVIVRPKKGVPLVAALGLAGFVAIVGAIIIVLLVRGGTPIVASPRVGPEGQDQLHLTCEGCPDGTVAHVGSSTATFKNKEADLDLPTPLKVGDNPLELSVEKSKGRADAVKLVVPVAFRVQPDLAQITAIPPALVVRVEAKPGSTVTIDGAPIALDANGSANQTIPLGDDARGPADETKTFVKSFAYEVKHDGKTDKGNVKASIPITPLRIDAPAGSATIEQGSVMITGRTAKSATITVDGKPVTPNSDGSFEAHVDVEADREVEIAAFIPKVGTAPPLGTRTTKVTVARVASLQAEGARQDKEFGLGYDALAANVNANLGQPFVVHGTVADARGLSNHRTLLIVDDQRGCAKSPCIVRVVYGGETPVVAGEWVRAYGKLSGTVPWNGQNVPDVEASFLLKGKK